MKPRLLVVEDELHIRRLVAATLEAAGFSVEAAEDGAVAWDRLRADGPLIEVVVLDLHMPNVDGFEVLRRMRRLDASMRPDCVVLTALGLPVDHARAIELGASVVLTKPFRPPQVVEAVQDRLASRRAAARFPAP